MERIKDAVLIAGLLKNGTVRATAAELNVSERTLFNRMKDGVFRELYTEYRADMLRDVLSEVEEASREAVNVVAEIMRNSEINAQTRLQACQTLINARGKIYEELRKTEQLAIAQTESNDTFSLF